MFMPLINSVAYELEAMAEPSGPPLDIRNTFGQILIATIVGTIFYGITLLQTGMYLNKYYSKDRGIMVSLVIFLCLMDTMTWILETYTVWFYFVVNYANPAALPVPVWSLKLEPGFTYTVALIANLFFIEKIYLVSNRNKFLALFLTLVALGSWGSGLAITALVFEFDLVSNTQINRATLTQKVFSTVMEFLITIFMCWLFKSNQSGISKRTDRTLTRLIVFSLSRGIVMNMVQLLYTIVYFVFPDQLYWVVFHFMLGKLFTNSVIASLNVREMMRGKDYAIETGTFRLASRQITSANTGTDRTFGGSIGTAVKVDQTIHSDIHPDIHPDLKAQIV